MILMIDNYDSFVFNLVQYLKALHEEVVVFRNDAVTLETIRLLKPEMIVLSPGPRAPKDAGICLEAINEFHDTIPILGICLGHQALGVAFGGETVKTATPVHGKVHRIVHDGKGVFQGLKSPLNVTRYHSLMLKRDTLPACFDISAESGDGVIMGIRHKEYCLEGVQFHPEALLSEYGMEMLRNFLDEARKRA